MSKVKLYTWYECVENKEKRKRKIDHAFFVLISNGISIQCKVIIFFTSHILHLINAENTKIINYSGRQYFIEINAFIYLQQ